MVSGKIVAETLEWKKEGEGMLNPTSEEPRIKKKNHNHSNHLKIKAGNQSFPYYLSRTYTQKPRKSWLNRVQNLKRNRTG